MREPNFISQEAGLNFNSTVEAIIKRSCIVDYGIVQEVISDGVVNVSVAVSRTKQDMVCMTCVLANIASSAFTLNVKPKKGDRVLIVYPRIYNDEMFNVTDDAGSDSEITVDFEAKGYNICSGIAILMNQYKTTGHKNVITIDEGNVTAKLNKVEVTTTSDGDISLKNPKATVTIDKNGNVKVNAQGKYTLKNATKDLLSVISSLNTILKSLKTTGSETAQTISSDTVGLLTNWENNDLKALLSAT